MSPLVIVHSTPWPAEPFGASLHSLPADPTSVIHPSSFNNQKSSNQKSPQLNPEQLIEGEKNKDRHKYRRAHRFKTTSV